MTAPVRRSRPGVLARSRENSPAIRLLVEQQPARLIGYGLWLLAVISLIEIALRLFEQISTRRIPTSRQVWNIPFAHGLPLVLAGLAIALLARGRLKRLALPTLIWASASIGFAGWLSMSIEGLHAAAALVLAAGIGVQVAKRTVTHAYLFDAAVKRTQLLLVGGLIVLAAGSLLWPRVSEARSIARLQAAPAEGPNVLFVVLDTVRAKSLSLYGYSRQTTPNLDRLSKGGVVFDRAFSTAPWTLPSHASMFTGRLPHELSTGWESGLDRTYPTIAEVFRDNGYLTAGFVANTIFAQAKWGLARGFGRYEDELITPGTLLRGSAFGELVTTKLRIPERFASPDEKILFKSAADINESFLRWLQRRRPGRPFFAFLNYFDAHAPYSSPAEYARRFFERRPRGEAWWQPRHEWEEQDIAELKDAYDASVAYLDDQVGALFRELDRRGDLADTIVVITSDHGEQFGEHGLIEHSTSLYIPVLHVPLIILQPTAVPAGVRIGDYVSLRDLPATLAELARLGRSPAFPGRSLSGRWKGSTTWTERDNVVIVEANQTFQDPPIYPTDRGDMRSTLVGGMQFIWNTGDDRQELYDLAADPDQLHDLAARQPELVKRYRDQLERLLSPVTNLARRPASPPDR